MFFYKNVLVFQKNPIYLEIIWNGNSIIIP